MSVIGKTCAVCQPNARSVRSMSSWGGHFRGGQGRGGVAGPSRKLGILHSPILDAVAVIDRHSGPRRQLHSALHAGVARSRDQAGHQQPTAGRVKTGARHAPSLNEQDARPPTHRCRATPETFHKASFGPPREDRQIRPAPRRPSWPSHAARSRQRWPGWSRRTQRPGTWNRSDRAPSNLRYATLVAYRADRRRERTYTHPR